MLQSVPIEEITRIISVSAAPAFLLGAIVGMLSLLIGLLSRMTDRLDKEGERKAGADASASHSKIARTRLHLIRAAVTLCVLSGTATGLMVDLVFVDTLFGWQNNRTIVLLFITAIVLFTAALVYFLLEVRLSIARIDHDLT